jgi:DNA invertase Pin-like site-specific DNA recombinase
LRCSPRSQSKNGREYPNAIAGLKVARGKGRILGRPLLPEETIQKVLLLNRHAGIGARKIAKSTGFPLGTVNAILTRSQQQLSTDAMLNIILEKKQFPGAKQTISEPGKLQ